MTFEFRKLTMDDLDAIKKIADEMPSYFRNIYYNAEYLINNPDCYYFGAFKNNQLHGVGNFRSQTKLFAWIESIRVAPENQKKGVGLALFAHCLEKAKNDRFRVIAFATEATNYGSNTIGQKLGFTLVDEMVSLWSENIHDIDIKSSTKSLIPIEASEAIRLIQQITNYSINEICIGWKFVPLDRIFLENNKDITFYSIDETILVDSVSRDITTNEIRYARAILYGSEENMALLLQDFLRRYKNYEGIGCFIKEEQISTPQKYGFQIDYNHEDKPNKVVFWKKILREKE